jgi:hypothetical protein
LVRAFVIAFSTLAALQQAGKRKGEKFLHVHRPWRIETTPARLALCAQHPERDLFGSRSGADPKRAPAS